MTRARPRRSPRLRRLTTVELGRRLEELVLEFIARCTSARPDQIAPGTFLRELSRAAARLEEMARRQPDTWSPLARKVVQWPILATLNPNISIATQAQLLDELQLGRDAFLSITRKSRTSTENTATRYALSILMTVEDNRDSWAELTDPHAPPWVKDARELPPFKATSWAAWWSVGKRAFLEVVPHPEKIEGLRNLARPKPTDAAKRALILERIARVIRGLAPRVGTPPPSKTEG